MGADSIFFPGSEYPVQEERKRLGEGSSEVEHQSDSYSRSPKYVPYGFSSLVLQLGSPTQLVAHKARDLAEDTPA